MKNPWICGQYDGHEMQTVDATSRLDAIKRMNADELRAVIAWPDNQKAVQQAAERKLRKLSKIQPGATMNSSIEEITPIIGTAMGGGYYAGRILIDGQAYALIVAPKDEGEHKDSIWIGKYKDVPDAKSYNDGQANTAAMAKAGSKLAKWALGLRIGGNDDWYLPSQDEMEIIYRNLKPTDLGNSCYARSGINLSAITPTRPYTPDFPVQTQAEAFQAGGEQAFDETWYWSSTQHAADSDYAWCQDFYDGHQSYNRKSAELRARAIRRLPI